MHEIQQNEITAEDGTNSIAEIAISQLQKELLHMPLNRRDGHPWPRKKAMASGHPSR